MSENKQSCRQQIAMLAENVALPSELPVIEVRQYEGRRRISVRHNRCNLPLDTIVGQSVNYIFVKEEDADHVTKLLQKCINSFMFTDTIKYVAVAKASKERVKKLRNALQKSEYLLEPSAVK